MASSEAEIQRQKEMQQADELLFSGRQEIGFAKGLFLGNFVADWVMPYPRLDPTRQTELESALSEVRQNARSRSRSGLDRSQCRHPAPPRRGPCSHGRSWNDGATGSWRPRFLANAVLPDPGGDRKTGRFH